MSDFTEAKQWFAYQETPRKRSQPIKLDAILAARLEAFLRAKEVRHIALDES